MEIEIRSDSVHITGYVNAVGRDSRPLIAECGKCVEQIAPGTFSRALRAAENVALKLDHGRVIGGTKDGTLKLREDNIGLWADTVIRDPAVIESARRKELRGWSFGFTKPQYTIEERGEKLKRRIVNELTLNEVSVIDSAMIPCYDGTSVEVRAGEADIDISYRNNVDENITIKQELPDYAALRAAVESEEPAFTKPESAR